MASSALSTTEETATTQFLEKVNCLRGPPAPPSSTGPHEPLPWATAVKFLMARKFDVARALALFEQHESTRHKEGLVSLDVSVEPLRTELRKGKFTILRCRDPSGAAIALFSARLHEPRSSTHQTTLQALVCQLDAALQSSDTQRHGLVFVYDMTDSLYQHFDYQLSQKILTLLKGAYPARLKKVLIVTAPLWFKAPFKVLRLFVREKLRDRVYTVTAAELAEHIPRECLPENLGGLLKPDHDEWLLTCIPAITKAKVAGKADTNGTITTTATTTGGRVTSTAHDLVAREDLESPEFSEDEDEDEVGGWEEAEDDLMVTGGGGEELPREEGSNGNPEEGEENGNEEEVVETQHVAVELEKEVSAVELASLGASLQQEECSSGVSWHDFVAHLKAKGRAGLHQDYLAIKRTPPEGSFDHSRRGCNQEKNRYTDVLCLDDTRVVLNDDNRLSSTEEVDLTDDYINANFVDGYQQRSAYISTQGPLAHTSGDFWRMVWRQRCVVVVMTTRVTERHRVKCAQYWPAQEGRTMRFTLFSVTNVDTEDKGDYIASSLRITQLTTGVSRILSHFQFASWPDYGVPDSATEMLRFVSLVRDTQARLTKGISWRGHPLGPPIIVHCSAGIGRTGTFCTLDISIRRLDDVGLIDVQDTVVKIRGQRAYSIQTADQYVFCHLALLEYILMTGRMTDADITGFEGGEGEE